MKINNIVILICAFFALSGTYFAIVTKHWLSVGVPHLVGPIPLLYVIPLYLMAVSILALKGKIKRFKSWYLPATIFGLLLSLLAYAGAKKTIGGYGGETSLGLGAYYLLGSYTIATAASIINIEKWRLKFKK